MSDVHLQSGTAKRSRWRLASLSIAAGVIVLLLAANAHLVYVAVASQPDCVPHASDEGDGVSFRAAKSAC